MKTGKTLVELAMEIQRQQDSKKDYVAPCQDLSVHPAADSGVMLQIGRDQKSAVQGGGNFGAVSMPINQTAHRQIGEYTNIPAVYYDRMASQAPELLAQNINHWFGSKPLEARMVRTLDNRVRALLSDRFRCLDNMDLAETVIPVIQELGVELISSEITEHRMYLKVVDKRILKDIPIGAKLGESHVKFDTLSPALVISNSEIGFGALSVQTSLWTGGCTNLVSIRERSMRKYHVGAKHDATEGIYELLTSETKRLTDKATFAQVRDVVKAAFDVVKFEALVDKVHGLASQKITADPVKVVEIAAKRFGLTDNERGSVLLHLVNGGDLSRYGLFNAVTRAAEDLESYDRATEFEQLGGDIIDLPASEWKIIANAEKLAA